MAKGLSGLLEIHEKIKTLRMFKKINVETVAKQLNMSKSAYYSRENGRVILNVKELFKLCQIFGVSPSIIFTNCKDKDEFLSLIRYEYFVKNVLSGEVHEC